MVNSASHSVLQQLQQEPPSHHSGLFEDEAAGVAGPLTRLADRRRRESFEWFLDLVADLIACYTRVRATAMMNRGASGQLYGTWSRAEVTVTYDSPLLKELLSHIGSNIANYSRHRRQYSH